MITDQAEALRASPRPQLRPRWGLPLDATLATMLAIFAIAVCAAVLNSYETQRRTALQDAAALSYVSSFMKEFTSPEPFHANDYTDRILAQATGDFADQYRKNQNEILIGIARSEPTTGEVLEVGVSRRNDDGSREVLAITKFTSTSTDGKFKAERSNRWVITARQEGDRWKISNLTPVL